MYNGFNEDTHYAILGMARELADLFEENAFPAANAADHSDQTRYISDEGLEAMGDTFEKIEPNFRANVFEHLLCELDERGIEFDIDQFKAAE